MTVFAAQRTALKPILDGLAAEINHPAHRLDLLLYALLLGTLHTGLFLGIFLAHRVIDHPLVMKAYQLSSLAVPLLTLGLLALVMVVKSAARRCFPAFYSLALLLNTAAVCLELFGPLEQPPAARLAYVIVPQALSLLALGLPAGWRRHAVWQDVQAAARPLVLFVLFALYFFLFLPGRSAAGIANSRAVCLAAFTAAAGWEFWKRSRFSGRLALRWPGRGRSEHPAAPRTSPEWAGGRTARLLATALLLLLLTLLVTDPYFYFSDNARYHHNFFLGPASDIRAGKDVLINTYSQYGLLLPYALAALLGGLSALAGAAAAPAAFSYPGFVLLINLLFIVQYALLYRLMRQLIASRALVLLMLALILYFNYFAVESFSLITFPAQGPLRYVWPYLILWLELARPQSAALRARWKGLLVLETGLVGLTAIWSVEVFLYTLTTFAVCCLVRFLPAWLYRRAGLKALVWELGAALIGISASWAAFLGLIAVRAHQLPQAAAFADYLSFLTLHVGTEVASTRAIPPDYVFNFWILAPAVYFGSLMACALRCLRRPPAAHPRYAVVAGLSAYGVLQFAYFFVFQENVHFAFLFIPLLMVGGFWLHQLFTLAFPGAIRAVVALGYVVIIAFLFFARLHLLTGERLEHTGLVYTARVVQSALAGRAWTDRPLERYLTYQPWNPQTAEAEALVTRFFADQPRLLIFIEPEDEVETLFHTGKTNVYPISHPKMVDIIPAIHSKILQQPLALQAGQRILIVNDASKLTALQQELAARIRQRAVLSPIYTSSVYTVLEVVRSR